MNIGFFSGASGLMAYQAEMDTVAHNMANVSTVGFKTVRSQFEDLIYSKMALHDEENIRLTGHGVKADRRQLLMDQGNLNQTNRELDFTIVGDGFFAIERDGQTQYTRNGNFGISVENDAGYLVTWDGAYVLDGAGKRINLPLETVKDQTTGEATGTTQNYDLKGVKDRLGIYRFPNQLGLEPTQGSSFLATAESGAAYSTQAAGVKDYDLLSNTLEQSAVNVSDEMTNIIKAQRGYQFSARLVQTADELEEILNNLR